MKITTNNSTGRVIFYPNADPSPREGVTIREITPEIQTVINSKGPFLWVPTDPEHPEGEGTLTKVVPLEPTPEQKIALGRKAVEAAGIDGFNMAVLQDMLLTTKEADALASKPKLVALYTWLQTVKGMAIAGQVNFPPTPHTFEEAVSE
jgi:hypothetical protein